MPLRKGWVEVGDGGVEVCYVEEIGISNSVCSFMSAALTQVQLLLKKSPYAQSVHVYWVLCERVSHAVLCMWGDTTKEIEV